MKIKIPFVGTPIHRVPTNGGEEKPPLIAAVAWGFGAFMKLVV